MPGARRAGGPVAHWTAELILAGQVEWMSCAGRYGLRGVVWLVDWFNGVGVLGLVWMISSFFLYRGCWPETGSYPERGGFEFPWACGPPMGMKAHF